MYLGIDLGTSAVKAVITNNNGDVVAQTSSHLSVNRPQPLWSEQAPQDWFNATSKAMFALAKEAPAMLKAVKAIGLSGQMHGATLLDANHEVLRPAILWNDGRCASECLELEHRVGDSRSITGNIAMPGFTAPKLLWVKQHEPEVFAKTRHVLLPKDYLRLTLTGELASDMSDSAGTLWMNVATRSWSGAMLSASDLSEANMPALYEGPETTGVLRETLAKQWGLNQVPVVAGAGDNAAGAIGAGVVTPGDAFLSLGTSGVYFLANARYSPNPDQAVHTFCHCLPQTWHQMSVSLSAASCLDWLAKLTGASSVSSLLEELEAGLHNRGLLRDNVPVFLPYLSGERTPHNNPEAKGVFFGLTHSTERAHLTQSVLEGVTYAFADGQQALLATGEPIEHVSVIGGGSRNRFWGEILASVLDRSLHFHEGAEVGPALGAARLAQLGVNNDDSEQAIKHICYKTPIQFSARPNAEYKEILDKRWQTYQKLYESTQALM